MRHLRGILGFAAPFLVGVSVGAVFLHPARPRTAVHPATWALVLLYVDEIVLALVLLGVLAVLLLAAWARRRGKRSPRRA